MKDAHNGQQAYLLSIQMTGVDTSYHSATEPSLFRQTGFFQL